MSCENLQNWLMENARQPASQSRFAAFLEQHLSLPEQSKVIIVGGTNGKGSTVIALESILLAAGHTVCSTISPHLIQLNERVRVNGSTCPVNQFQACFSFVKQCYLGESLNWFEFITAIFVSVCQQQQPDYVIVEVGVGGRYCISNCFEPDLCIVTNVALDHQAILGNTREAIGWQKAGIFRARKPAICGDEKPPRRLVDYAKEIDANLEVINKEFSVAETELQWQYRDNDGADISLIPSNAKPSNLACACRAARLLGIDEYAIQHGCADLSLAGRWQQVSRQPEIWLDVAHNSNAMTLLIERLKQLPTKNTHCLFMMKKNKDVKACLSLLAPHIAQLYIAEDPEQSENTGESIPHTFIEQSLVVVSADLDDAIDIAIKQTQQDSRLLVVGSFIIVGKVLQRFGIANV